VCPSFGAPGVDVASFDRPGQVEVQFGSAAGGDDGDIADVRVPRKLSEQSEADRKRRVTKRWGPLVASTDRGWLIGVHDVCAVAAALEGIIGRDQIGNGGDRVVNSFGLEITVL
jgi:hypothetical protein